MDEYIDGIDALEQAIRLVFATRRYAYPIYSHNYGNEFSKLYGLKGAVFESEAVFRRKLKSYIKHCTNEKARRLPNAAGFCRFCSISRSDFAQLRISFPLMFDIAQSTFIDEALNTKFPNSAANMSFITDFNNSISGEGKDTVRIICEHDPSCDGE